MRLWGTVLGCWCAASLSLATAQQVEFPLEFYSFAEIAQRMSIEGRRIECARDLRQRLALIHLKPRTWQETRELLEKALDVRFRKISDAENRWVLERDPEVARVERQRRERLANSLDKEGFAELRLMQIFLDKSISPEKVLEIAQELDPDFTVPEEHRKEAFQLIELMRELPLETALRNWRAHKRLNQRFMNAMRSDDAALALTEQSLSELGFSAAELQWAEQVAQSKDEKWQLLLGSSGSESESPAQRKAQALFSLGMFAEGYLSIYSVNTLLSRLQPSLRALEAIEQGIVARVYDLALPPELAAWLCNDVDGARIPLNATDPVPTRLLATARWGQLGYDYYLDIQPLDWEFTGENIFTTHPPQLRKLLMLSPESAQKAFQRFDPDLAQAYQAAYERHKQLLQDPSVRAPFDNSARTLTRALYEWAQKHKAELIAEVYPEPFGGQGKTLTERLGRNGVPCLLERHDTVWVLRQWAAFVQRVPDLPLTALRDLMRTKGDYADWRAFYRAVTPEQARWLVTVGYAHPPEVTRLSNQEVYPTIDEFGKAWLFTIVLEQLPPALRNQLWEYTDEQKPLTVALATLSPNARVQLAQILSQWRAALGTSQSRRFFSEDPAALVEQLVLYRTGTWWMLSLPESPSDHTRFSFDKSLVFSLAPCPLPLKDDTPPEVIFHRR
jgi:hypothetical protein